MAAKSVALQCEAMGKSAGEWIDFVKVSYWRLLGMVVICCLFAESTVCCYFWTAAKLIIEMSVWVIDYAFNNDDMLCHLPSWDKCQSAIQIDEMTSL